ncbi:hypothetical protein BGZ60DRAFT_334555, partial [Tricladium varicosporioides]
LFVTLSLPTVAEATFYSTLNLCPAPCDGTPESWTVYNAVDYLAACNQPMLFDFAVYNPLDDPLTHNKIRSCTVEGAAVNKSSAPTIKRLLSASTNLEKRNSYTPTCISATETKANMEFISLRSDESSISNLLVVLQEVQNFLQNEEACNSKLIFGYYRGAVVGVYTGAAIDNHATAPSVIQKLIGQVRVHGTTDIILQLCGSGRSSDNAFGVVTDTTEHPNLLSSLQKSVRSWSDGMCNNSKRPVSQLNDISIWESAFRSSQNYTSLTGRRLNLLNVRSDCPTASVASGDSCSSLASKCSISASDFTNYNPEPSLCANLQPGQRVCCGAGMLPDIRPKKNDNGTCASYTVVADDNCSKIAATNGLNKTQIETFNNGTTWGWSGCTNIMVGTTICLSDGTPPMPAPVSNAVCGPTKPGTLTPDSTQKLSDLSPCPLNACCNVWGQCGIDPDFCTEVRGPSGNPGTSLPGTNGCVQNCGLNITNNDKGPEKVMSVGYYEAWNWDRPCLHQRAADLGKTAYTHLHWAFGTINPDFTVTVNDTYKQFNNFSSLQNVKKIISIGGWGVSTDPATYDLLRQAMMPANANKFATQIVSFVIENVLDGVDFDWEYPGAPDIPGIPAGLDSDGPNYLAFLQQLRTLLPKSMTISIAAPASYWYLKAFPIAEMAKTVDYIVYMTYDLHGQWDYGNKWSSPGCPNGNCLRSHVNLTETIYALAMITKAGVPSNKLNVGISSYGRSFEMSDATCSGPECTFKGPLSSAEKGQCTGVAGILAKAEIDQIIDIFAGKIISRYDDPSASDILIYENNNWVAYLSDNSKTARKDTYQKMNFAGTVDWALDLQSFENDVTSPTSDNGDESVEEQPYTGPPLETCSGSYTTFEQLEKDAAAMPSHCRALYAIQALDALLTSSLAKYTAIMANGYDDKFNTYADSVVESASKNVVDFYTNNGNKYFTCNVLEMRECCLDCRRNNPSPNDPQCKYCFDGPLAVREGVSIISGGGKPKQNIQWANVTEPCPPDYSLRGQKSAPYKATVYWSLQPDKANLFWADLLNATGISSDNIAFKNINNYPCDGYPKDLCIYYGDWSMNVPAPQGYDKSDIPNPKDLVSSALKNTQNLSQQIKNLLLNIYVNSYQGNPLDAVDALGIPVTLIADAVENMATVAAIGKEVQEAQKKAKREEIIFGFLTAILLFIPIAGEVMSAVAGMATIGRIVALMGTLGNVAFDSYTIVKDPANAPLAIFGLILAPLGLSDVVAIGKAARIARAINPADLLKLGANVGKRLAILRKVTKIC